MMFWFLIGLLSLLAMSAVVFPLVLRRSSSPDPMGAAKSLYAARIGEIEHDQQLGRLSTEDANAAKAEVARNLIRFESETKAGKNRGGKIAIPSFLVSALFVPALALAIYGYIGSPPRQLPPSSDDGQPSIETLVQAAEKRLTSNPDDVRGWTVIAPVYTRLGRYEEAKNAYRNIMRLEGRKPEYTFALGEIFMAEADGRVTDKALELFQETVKLEPAHPVANYYLGIRFMQQGDNQAAISKWQEMLDRAQGDEEWLTTIKARIAELEGQTTQPEAPSQTQDQIEMINGMVAGLEEKLAETPEDREGWQMLIRSYLVLERKQDALDAISRAKKLFADDQSFVLQLEKLQNNIGKQQEDEGDQ